MKKSAILATAAAAVLLASLLAATSDGATGTKRMDKTAVAKVEMYAVVQIGEELSVVKKSDLANLKKSTAEEDKKKMKDYEEAKKAATKNKESFDLPKPVKRSVKILKNSLKSEQAANDWKEKFLREKDGSKSDTSKTSKKTAN